MNRRVPGGTHGGVRGALVAQKAISRLLDCVHFIIYYFS